MNNERLLESKALRAQLRTVRNVEQALRELRADRFLEFLYSADRTFFKALFPCVNVSLTHPLSGRALEPAIGVAAA